MDIAGTDNIEAWGVGNAAAVAAAKDWRVSRTKALIQHQHMFTRVDIRVWSLLGSAPLPLQHASLTISRPYA